MKGYFSLISIGTKVKCLGVLLLALVSSILASIWPIQLGEIYSKISDGKISSVEQGFATVVLFGFVYLTAECITIVRRVLLDCIIAQHEAEIRGNSVEKLLKMPVSYYSGELSGKRTAELNQGVAGLSQLIKICCNDVFATVLIAICTLTQVVKNAPVALAGIMFMYLVLTVMISVFQIRSQSGIRESIIAQKNALDGQICQSIINLELIRSMNAEKYEKVRLTPNINKISLIEKMHHKYMGTFDIIKQACKIVFQVIILLISIQMITRQEISPGGVISVCLLFQQLIKPIDEVYRFMDEMASSVVKTKVLTELTSSGTDPVFDIKSSGIHTDDSDIILKDVVITNPERNKQLAVYDGLRIPGNKIVALKGMSGCGKTTIIRGLNRYYPYISGNISLFGHNLDSYSQQELTEKLFYVPQQVFFFAGTIGENLVYGLDHEVTEAEMLNALRRACLLDVLNDKVNEKPQNGISKYKGALSYCIGEGGIGLSGGERQRLSIARAFLRRPKIFIFDESTANLDIATAETVLSNIEDYARKNGSGIVYISHDKNVVDRCDEVILVENKVGNMSGIKEAV